MTNEQILRAALLQSAAESGCDADDFLAGRSRVVLSRTHPAARKYLELPFFCDLTSYGSCVVASVSPDIADFVQEYIDGGTPHGCFETPRLHLLEAELQRHGMSACFQAEYWLPDTDRLRPLPCPYEMRLLRPADLAGLYLPQWSNALCAARRELDCLAVGAYDGGTLIGLAGCSADCDSMRQIGIDVLPAYRRRGVASALTSRLAAEILMRDKVPFYCCAWSNVASARNAIRSGFRPAWVQLTARPAPFTMKLAGACPASEPTLQ